MISIRQTGVVLASLICALALLIFSSMARGEPAEDAVDQTPNGAQYAAGELIVTYKDEAPEPKVQALGEEDGAEVEKNFSELDAKVLEFPEVKRDASQSSRESELARKKEALEKDPAVEEVFYNYVRTGMYTPNDPKFMYQYGLKKPGFQRAWNRTRGRGTRIAVIDSGVEYGRQEFRRKVVAHRDFANDNYTVEDLNGHGTHVAGIMAARTGNGVGVAGGCPGCKLVVGKALDKNLSGYDSDIAEAISWSARKNAKVINLSLGGAGKKSVLKKAIDYATGKGAVVVAAAANPGYDGPVYPAAYNNVIAVTATGSKDRRSSSYGTGYYIDVAAPGFDILSTVPGGYAYKSGTSMATPHVSALAGLLASQGRGPGNIRYRILRTTVDLGPAGRDRYYGTGRINAEKATRR